jgi:UDP:flavonoid glycosyltransferase YjiC (YdhE family)
MASAAERTRGLRIALAADGTRGDIHPMLALARGLDRRGHEVLLCAPPNFAADAASAHVAFHPVGMDVRAYLESRAAILHGGVLSSLGEGQRYVREQVGRQMSDLARAIGRADWILGAGSQFAASSVAELLGARYRMVAYCPSVLRSRHQTPFAVPRGELPHWANRAAWWALGSLVKRGLGRAIDDARVSLGLAPARDHYRLLFGERPALAAETVLAPLAPDLAREVVTIGCLHPFQAEPLPPKLEAFLDAGEAPVYIGFGSMTDPDPAAATRVVLGAVERAGVRAVLSQGWAGLGCAPLPEGVLEVGPVCHASLFERVAMVVHHGGAGTTTTAARAGVPQILVPHVVDQFHWAHRVGRLGLGPPAIARRRLCEALLAEAIGAVRDNEFLAERAAELGARLRAELATRPDPAELVLS